MLYMFYKSSFTQQWLKAKTTLEWFFVAIPSTDLNPMTEPRIWLVRKSYIYGFNNYRLTAFIKGLNKDYMLFYI